MRSRAHGHAPPYFMPCHAVVIVMPMGLAAARAASFMAAPGSLQAEAVPRAPLHCTVYTPPYCCPVPPCTAQVLRCERYDEKADVYSYGVVLWEVGRHLFNLRLITT